MQLFTAKLREKFQKIGVNTLEDPATGETYYPITILAEDKTLIKDPMRLLSLFQEWRPPLNLLGEKRSIAQYIMKPFKKFQLEAFTDR